MVGRDIGSHQECTLVVLATWGGGGRLRHGSWHTWGSRLSRAPSTLLPQPVPYPSCLCSHPGVSCPGPSAPTPSAGRKMCVPSSGPPDQRATSTAPRNGTSFPMAAGEAHSPTRSPAHSPAHSPARSPTQPHTQPRTQPRTQTVSFTLLPTLGAVRARVHRTGPLGTGDSCPSVQSPRSEVPCPLLPQGQLLVASLRGAEGLLPLLPEEQVPEGAAAEDVGGGAGQRGKRLRGLRLLPLWGAQPEWL